MPFAAILCSRKPGNRSRMSKRRRILILHAKCWAPTPAVNPCSFSPGLVRTSAVFIPWALDTVPEQLVSQSHESPKLYSTSKPRYASIRRDMPGYVQNFVQPPNQDTLVYFEICPDATRYAEIGLDGSRYGQKGSDRARDGHRRPDMPSFVWIGRDMPNRMTPP